MAKLYPVILSGGSGTRLWPLSRPDYPKQYIPLDGDTLFGQCLERTKKLKESLELGDVASPIVLCNQEHRFLAAAIMQEKGLPPSAEAPLASRLVLEPVGRGTAPAIAVSALAALEEDPEALILVMPSDHRIRPQSAFMSAVTQAVRAAKHGHLVTFGVRPGYPATGYGYIVRGQGVDGAFSIERFVEKPDVETAKKLIEKGGCFWNSGIFLFPASLVLSELGRLAPSILSTAQEAWQARRCDLDFIRLDAETFGASPADSIDYAVLEKTDKAAVVPFGELDWHDLGAWESFHEIADKDADGNSKIGDVELLDSRNNYIHATYRLVGGIGLENLVVVESPDAVLVMEQGRGQDVKTLLERLKCGDRPEAERHIKVHRPWGSYETLAAGAYFQVKHILVKPGASLSLQMHNYRAEHWVVVRGVAKILVGDKEVLLEQNQSTYIPRQTRHRLENPTHMDLELIEVQSGSYLGEDDIVRFEDTYGRAPDV